MTEPKGAPPAGYADEVELNADGWWVWKAPPGESAACPGEGCDAPYDPDDPLMALECPECGAVGCDDCMPVGRGCLCPACEDDEEVE